MSFGGCGSEFLGGGEPESLGWGRSESLGGGGSECVGEEGLELVSIVKSSMNFPFSFTISDSLYL